MINVKPGYQKMCGQRALEYVRYRHTDNDIVRGARQQDFLRQVRSQVTASKLLDNVDKLIDIFADNTRSDIQSTGALRRLLKIMLGVSDKPIKQVKFHGRLGESYVSASPAQIKAAARQFLYLRPARAARKQRKRSKTARKGGKSGAKVNLIDFTVTSRGQGQLAKHATSASPSTTRASSCRAPPTPRTRRAPTRSRRPTSKRFRAYKMVIFTGYIGEYYGVQGTSWRDPPILAARRPRSARSGAASTCSSTTATACAWSAGRPSAARTGSRTRCCRRSPPRRCWAWRAPSSGAIVTVARDTRPIMCRTCLRNLPSE